MGRLTPPGGCRILGIDPGSRITGYGVIEKIGNRYSYVTCGVIRVATKRTFAERLWEIHAGITEVIETHKPGLAAVEDLFVSINPRSALKLGQARGVILLAAMQHGLQLHEYTPRTVKQAVCGHGQAGKSQVQHMVRALLQLSASPSQDAADALAVALCCANLCECTLPMG